MRRTDQSGSPRLEKQFRQPIKKGGTRQQGVLRLNYCVDNWPLAWEGEGESNVVRGAAGGFGYWRCCPLPRAGRGGEAAAEAEETGWLSAWSGGAPSYRQYPFPGRGAASHLHEETKSAVRASMFGGTSAAQKGAVSLFILAPQPFSFLPSGARRIGWTTTPIPAYLLILLV